MSTMQITRITENFDVFIQNDGVSFPHFAFFSKNFLYKFGSLWVPISREHICMHPPSTWQHDWGKNSWQTNLEGETHHKLHIAGHFLHGIKKFRVSTFVFVGFQMVVFFTPLTHLVANMLYKSTLSVKLFVAHFAFVFHMITVG